MSSLRSFPPMNLSTRAHQLAVYVVFFVPFQMVADAPQAYENQPEFKFILDVPAAWDETRVIEGSPAEDITVARRRGKEWYVGSITNWSPRTVMLALDFPGNGEYTAEFYQDARHVDQYPEHVAIEKKRSSGTINCIWNSSPAEVLPFDSLPAVGVLSEGGRCATRYVFATLNPTIRMRGDSPRVSVLENSV
jgi:hypothetical protein